MWGSSCAGFWLAKPTKSSRVPKSLVSQCVQKETADRQHGGRNSSNHNPTGGEQGGSRWAGRQLTGKVSVSIGVGAPPRFVRPKHPTTCNCQHQDQFCCSRTPITSGRAHQCHDAVLILFRPSADQQLGGSMHAQQTHQPTPFLLSHTPRMHLTSCRVPTCAPSHTLFIHSSIRTKRLPPTATTAAAASSRLFATHVLLAGFPACVFAGLRCPNQHQQQPAAQQQQQHQRRRALW